MRKIFANITAFAVTIVYLVSMIGIGVHVCGSTGMQELSVPLWHISCPADTCADGCCDSADHGALPSFGSSCHSDIVSVDDDMCSSQPQYDLLRVMASLIMTGLSFFLNVLPDTDIAVSFTGRAVPILPAVSIFSTVLRL